MFFIVAAMLVAGAFAIVGMAAAAPISPWQQHIGARTRANAVVPSPEAGIRSKARRGL